jgi:Protein of unknown function (DUF3093)
VGTPTLYRERLSVAWWAWPAALAGAAMLATELAIGAFALRTPLTYVVAGGLAALGLLALNRIRVRVEPSELHVDDAHLPLSAIGSVTVLDAEARRDLLGQDAEPLAFVIQRPWIPGGVRIDVDDPTDPTPYWYVSSRHPRELAAALGFPAPTA